MNAQRPPLSILEQARLVDRLVGRCVMKEVETVSGRSGELAREAHLTITAEDADDLHHLALRLHRMAPYEERIRKAVMGK